MDYSTLHGPGTSNFSSSNSNPSPHRMPTVSAAQALQDLASSPSRCVSTTLTSFDIALQNRESTAAKDPFYGGVTRGMLTEIYGPSGVGKTTIGAQLSSSALEAGDGVVWVDGSQPVCGPRLNQILSARCKLESERSSADKSLANFVHFSVPTLAHFIAFLSQPIQTHPSSNISLMVIDSFTTLINNAFPRSADSSSPRKPGAPNPSARKLPIIQYIVNALQKLAATHNIAVVILSQCITKMRSGEGAALIPAINTTAWEQGLSCRVVLYRDWGWDDENGKPVKDARLAQVLKAEGQNIPDTGNRLAGFTITESGLQPLNLPSLEITPYFKIQTPITVLPQKRKIVDTDLEIPDSDGEDDEDYGWAEEDEEDIPPPAPQWQGSEDILVPAEGELEADEEEEEQVEEDAAHENDRAHGEIEDSEDELAL